MTDQNFYLLGHWEHSRGAVQTTHLVGEENWSYIVLFAEGPGNGIWPILFVADCFRILEKIQILLFI